MFIRRYQGPFLRYLTHSSVKTTTHFGILPTLRTRGAVPPFSLRSRAVLLSLVTATTRFSAASNSNRDEAKTGEDQQGRVMVQRCLATGGCC